jgi:hypothetical protein
MFWEAWRKERQYRWVENACVCLIGSYRPLAGLSFGLFWWFLLVFAASHFHRHCSSLLSACFILNENQHSWHAEVRADGSTLLCPGPVISHCEALRQVDGNTCHRSRRNKLFYYVTVTCSCPKHLGGRVNSMHVFCWTPRKSSVSPYSSPPPPAKATTVMLPVNLSFPFMQCYLFSKSRIDGADDTSTHLAYLLKRLKGIFVLFSGLLVASSLSFPCAGICHWDTLFSCQLWFLTLPSMICVFVCVWVGLDMCGMVQWSQQHLVHV